MERIAIDVAVDRNCADASLCGQIIRRHSHRDWRSASLNFLISDSSLSKVKVNVQADCSPHDSDSGGGLWTVTVLPNAVPYSLDAHLDINLCTRACHLSRSSTSSLDYADHESAYPPPRADFTTESRWGMRREEGRLWKKQSCEDPDSGLRFGC